MSFRSELRNLAFPAVFEDMRTWVLFFKQINLALSCQDAHCETIGSSSRHGPWPLQRHTAAWSPYSQS